MPDRVIPAHSSRCRPRRPPEQDGPGAGIVVRLLVVHCIDNVVGEVEGRAVRQAQAWQQPATYDAQGDPVDVGAAHTVVDDAVTVACVDPALAAFHAGGVNDWSEGIELCQGASQTPAQWADPYSEAVLRRAAAWCARRCIARGIPPVFTADVDHGTGLTGHAQVSAVHASSEGHTDPGPNFPWDRFLGMVREAMGQGALLTVTEDDDVPNPTDTVAAFPRRKPDAPNGTAGTYVVQADGGVFAYDGAPFYGSLPNLQGLPHRKMGVDDIVGGCSTEHGDGYWLVGRDATIFAFGPGVVGVPIPTEVERAVFTLMQGRKAVAIVPYADGYAIVDDHQDRHPFHR